VMHERALSVNLDPEIEAECISDLSQHCSELTAKSEVCSLFISLNRFPSLLLSTSSNYC